MQVQLHVELWQWIVSQVLAGVILVLTVWGFSIRSKRNSLALFVVCGIISVPMNILLENWIMMYFSIFFIVRNAAFWLLEVRGERVSLQTSFYIFVALTAIAVVIVALVWSHWFDWVLLSGTLATGFGKWLSGNRGVHGMRITKTYKCLLVIVNSIMFLNAVKVLVQLITLIAIGVFYVRFFRRKAR